MRTIAWVLGMGRVAIGVTFIAAPVPALRLLGVDSATAARVSWLSRMTAARDGVLGAGTAMSIARNRGSSGWLLAGATSDAAVLAAAIRGRRMGGIGASAMAALAGGGAVLGLAAAAAGARHR